MTFTITARQPARYAVVSRGLKQWPECAAKKLCREHCPPELGDVLSRFDGGFGRKWLMRAVERMYEVCMPLAKEGTGKV